MAELCVISNFHFYKKFMNYYFGLGFLALHGNIIGISFWTTERFSLLRSLIMVSSTSPGASSNQRIVSN